VAPGVCHLLELPIPPGFQGENPFAPAFRPDRTRFGISQTTTRTHLAALRSGFKLIRDGNTGASALYDVVRDPGETRDVTALHPSVARDLRTRLAAWRWAQLDH